MRRFISSVAFVVMLLMMLPTLACATTVNMSRTEQDCCRQMHGQCGEMAKTGCCQVQVRDDAQPLPSHIVHAPILPVIVAAILHSFVMKPRVLVGYRWHLPDEHSPPGLLVASTTVLRV